MTPSKKYIMEEILKELRELKNLATLLVKQALTMNDAAMFTGLSKSQLYKLVSSKKIPYYKNVGGKLTFFDKDELTEWMLQNRVRTKKEAESDARTLIAEKLNKRSSKLK